MGNCSTCFAFNPILSDGGGGALACGICPDLELQNTQVARHIVGNGILERELGMECIFMHPQWMNRTRSMLVNGRMTCSMESGNDSPKMVRRNLSNLKTNIFESSSALAFCRDGVCGAMEKRVEARKWNLPSCA